MIPDFDDAGGKDDDKDQPERFLRFIEREEQKKREMLVAEERKKKKRVYEEQVTVAQEHQLRLILAHQRLLQKTEITSISPLEYANRDTAVNSCRAKVRHGAVCAIRAKNPRRGEVGYSSEQIENFEKMGYVMSGSRHARMNAVRLRKENQVYSAEEQAALAMINYEEKAAKEKEVMEELKRLVNQAKKD